MPTATLDKPPATAAPAPAGKPLVAFRDTSGGRLKTRLATRAKRERRTPSDMARLLLERALDADEPATAAATG